MSAISTHIDRLRDLRAAQRPEPDVAQLGIIVADIFHAVPLARTLARPELAGFTGADIGQIVVDFGQFRARSHKGGPKAATLLPEDTGMLPGFVPSRAEVLARSRGFDERGRKVRQAGWQSAVDHSLVAEVPAVVLPDGYEPKALGRDIRASLAALVITMPETSELERFWARRYTKPVAELTAEHLYLVWWLASHQLGSVLDGLDAQTEHLNGLLVRAHDLLETARTDADAAVKQLADSGSHQRDVDDLQELVAASSWVSPGTFTRIDKALAALAVGDNDRLRSWLRSKLASLASWHAQGPLPLRDIAFFNAAHMWMLAERSGLAFDAVEERKVRNEIRARLTDLGLAADLDQELPAGVAAWRTGRLEEFYSSREARAAGDPDWQSMLSSEADVTVAEGAGLMPQIAGTAAAGEARI